MLYYLLLIIDFLKGIMQPHSMCAVAVAGYMWNRPYRKSISRLSMDVEYRSEDKFRNLVYDISNIQESSDQREIKLSIVRAGGGLACTMLIRRSSAAEGSKVTMTHETTHVAGLREEYYLYKNTIQSGRHHNSRKYGDFSGSIDESRENLTMICGIRNIKTDRFYDVVYRLKIRL